MKKFYLPFLILNLLFDICNSQWIHYTPENTSGIPGTLVTSVISDHLGNIWCGTDKGLAQFEKEFDVWNIFDNTDGLVNDFIYQVIEDHEGSIWIATNGGGVSQYRNQGWTNFSTANGLPSNIIRAITETPGGDLLFGSYGKGIVKFNSSGFSDITPTELKDSYVLSLHATDDGSILIGTLDQGLFKLMDTTLTCLNEENGLISSQVFCIYSTSDRDVWVGTDKGAQMIDVANWIANPCPATLIDKSVFSICENAEGDLLLGSEDWVYKNTNGSYSSFVPEDSITSESYFSIHYDGEGHGWIGTSEHGLFYSDSIDWINYQSGPGLSSYDFYSICEDNLGNMWFSNDYGLNYFDFTNWTSIENPSGYSTYNQTGLINDLEGNIWCQTYYDLRKYDGNQWTVYTQINGEYFNNISDIEIDQQGKVWVGTYDNGLFVFDGSVWNHYTISDGLSSDNIMAIDINREGKVGIVSNNGIIGIYDGITWSKNTIIQDQRYVSDILLDSKGSIWLTTDRGLLKINGKFVESFFDQNWYYSSVLEEDNDSNIWTTVNDYEIYVYDGTTWQNYSEIREVPNIYIYDIFFDSRDHIWLASVSGIYRSDNILSILEPSLIPEIEVTLYPNPVTDLLQIQINSEETGFADLSFYALDGRLVHSLKISVIDISPPGIQLETESWPEGLIICRISLNDKHTAMKLIKLTE
jgi:two-component system sensor histidine kinase ChiS